MHSIVSFIFIPDVGPLAEHNIKIPSSCPVGFEEGISVSGLIFAFHYHSQFLFTIHLDNDGLVEVNVAQVLAFVYGRRLLR